ncbi:MAG: phosphonatase-like hydrolase [Gemmataceae bacterium]
MTLELVVLDLAGTTVHDPDAVGVAFRGALAAVGVTAQAEAVTAVMGLPKPQAVRLLLTRAGRTPSEAEVQAVHDDFVTRMKQYYATSPEVREIDGAHELIRSLRVAGLRVALNTGFSREITDILLTRLNWHPPTGCDAVVCSDEVARGRPYPDMIHELMRRLNVSDPKKVAKVGDTAADLGEGTAAGCGLVIGVTTGTHTAEQLRGHPHTHLADSLAEVQRILLGQTSCQVDRPGAAASLFS